MTALTTGGVRGNVLGASSYRANATPSDGTVTTIVDPSTNTKGLRISHLAVKHGSGVHQIYVGTSAPSGETTSYDCVLATSNGSANACGVVTDIVLPAGYGVYALAAVGSNRYIWMSYEVL